MPQVFNGMPLAYVGVLRPYVGTEKREGCLLAKVFQMPRAEIEIRMADADGVIAHQVHDGDVHFATVHRGHRRAHQEVSAVHDEEMFDFLSDLFDQDGTPFYSPESGERAVFDRLNGAVMFAGVQNCDGRSEEHTSELQSLAYLVCRLLLEKKKKIGHVS